MAFPVTGYRRARIVSPLRIRRNTRRRILRAAVPPFYRFLPRNPYVSALTGPTARYMGAAGLAAYGGYRAYKGFRRYRRRTRRQRISGTPLSSIRHEDYFIGTSSTMQSLERKTLLIEPIRFNRPPADNDTIGGAPGMTYRLTGFRLCAHFQNPNAGVPMEVHWALIQAKTMDQTSADMKAQFFTDPGNTGSRARAFVDFASSPVHDYRNLCHGLNKREFNVITHQKFTLANRQRNSGDVNAGRLSNFKKVDRWIKVNKNFSYTTTVSNDIERPIFFCCWTECADEPTGLSQPINLNVMSLGVTKRPGV